MIEKLRDRLDRLPYSPSVIAFFFGALTFLLRSPFLFRYDLFFGSDPGICYLMPLRILKGDRPFYFYSETHQGSTESYLTALLFKVFGPSIPLAAGQSLFLWAIAVALGVYLLTRSTSKFHGVAAGLVAAISVPYTLIYVTVPYIGYPGSFMITMLVLVQAYVILEKGPTGWRFFWFSWVVGTGLFVGKQCLPAVGACLLAMALVHTPACDFRRLLKPLFALGAATGLLLGYWPEILYRLTHPGYRDFSKLADPWGMFCNLKECRKALFAYFDAHPFSRIPTDIYFYRSIPYWGVHCAGPVDLLFAGLGLAVLYFSYKILRRSLVEKNAGLFLLTSLLFLNILAVVISRESVQNIFNVRRYLHTSAISISLLTGYLFTFLLLKLEKKYFQWALFGLAALFLLRSAWHQYAFLGRPDGLREIRWLIRDMKANGLYRGISNYGPNYSANALSEESVIIGNFDGDLIPEYADLVSQADKVAVIGYKGEPIEDKINFHGHDYQRIGDPHINEILRWTPYRKIS